MLATDSKVINSRDVTWLERMYGPWKGLTKANVAVPDDEVIVLDEDEEKYEPEPEEEEETNNEPPNEERQEEAAEAGQPNGTEPVF